MKEIDMCFHSNCRKHLFVGRKKVIIVKLSTVIKAIVKYIWDVEPFWFKCKIL